MPIEKRVATEPARSPAAAPAPSPRPASRRVLIVEDETLPGVQLASRVEQLGHTVVGQADNTRQAGQMFREHSPDLVLMDIRLGESDGIELAAVLLEERPCPMIITTAYSDETLHARAAMAGAYGYLIKPVTKDALAAAIAIAVRRFDELARDREEIQSLTTALETQKLVARAKGILMKRLSLDESAAHKRLQSESQKRRVSISEIAKRVIESEKVLGGG